MKTPKTIIYLRTSTQDQNPMNQLNECLNFCKSRNFEINQAEDIFIEKESAWKKSIVRPKYNLIKKLSHQGQIKTIVVWSLDRWTRNRETLIDDINYLTSRNVKIYSVKEPFLESINIEGPLGKTIKEFLFGIVGSLSEMESSRRSSRIKIAYENYQGHTWGRKKISSQSIKKVLELHRQGFSIREISKKVEITDKNNNLKNISKSSVHKIISENTKNNTIQNTKFDTFNKVETSL